MPKTYYVRSGEVDEALKAKSAKDAAKLALKTPNKSLGQQVFVNDQPIKPGEYNGETMFHTDSLLDEMVQDHEIKSFEEDDDGGFQIVG